MYKVLIVEDDPMVAMINEQYVCKNKNFSVVKTCRNGQEALDFLNGSQEGSCQEKNSVDLVIMDVFMPLLSGVETLKKIRENKLNCEVIMVTAANDPATLEETIHLGVIDFLIKPFAYERFQVALEKFTAKAEAFRGANQTIDQSYVDSLISNPGSGAGHMAEKELQDVTNVRLDDLVSRISGFSNAWEVNAQGAHNLADAERNAAKSKAIKMIVIFVIAG